MLFVDFYPSILCMKVICVYQIAASRLRVREDDSETRPEGTLEDCYQES